MSSYHLLHRTAAQLSVTRFRKLLQNSTSLETLTLHHEVIHKASLWHALRTPSFLPAPIYLPALKSLALRGIESKTVINYLIRQLDIPHVREVTLSDSPGDTGDYLDFTTTFRLIASTPDKWTEVEVLTLDRVYSQDITAFAELFCVLAGLERLHIISVHTDISDEAARWAVGESYLGGFLSPDPQGPLCPKLTSLKTSGVPGRLLVDCAKSRREGGVPIVSIVSDIADNVSGTELRSQGVGVLEYTEIHPAQ